MVVILLPSRWQRPDNGVLFSIFLGKLPEICIPGGDEPDKKQTIENLLKAAN